MKMKKIKTNDKGDYCLLLNPLSDKEVEGYATMPLAKFTLSSTVAYGSDPAFLSYLLESFNEACLDNNPNVVMHFGKGLLESGATRYIEAPKREVILAVARAISLMEPRFKFKEVYDYLLDRYYPGKFHSWEEAFGTPLPSDFDEE